PPFRRNQHTHHHPALLAATLRHARVLRHGPLAEIIDAANDARTVRIHGRRGCSRHGRRVFTRGRRRRPRRCRFLYLRLHGFRCRRRFGLRRRRGRRHGLWFRLWFRLWLGLGLGLGLGFRLGRWRRLRYSFWLRLRL